MAGATCYGDRNPHTYVGTAAGLTQGVDEEWLLPDFADEDQFMAPSKEAITVADKDWQGFLQNFPCDGRPPDDEKVRAQVLGISEHEQFKKQDPGHIPLPKARAMMEKARNRLQVLLSRELHPIVFGYLWAGIGADEQGYHRDHPMDALPSGNIAVSCFMSLSGDLVDQVANAISWVLGSVRGLPKPWVVRTLMLEEGNLGCLRSDVIHNGGGGERDSSVYKLFVAFSTVWRPTLYQRTVGVVVPAWGHIPGVRAAVRKCGIKGCTVVPVVQECLYAVCGKVEMCATHANGTCDACTNFEDPTPPAIPVPEQMQVQLPQAFTCLVLAKGSEALVWVEPMAGVPAFCRRDLDLGDPQCPMAHRTHPGFVAPGDGAYYRLSAGTVLVVACRFSVLAYPLPHP